MAVPAADELQCRLTPPPNRSPAILGASLDSWETDLAAMAADPQIQAELHRIRSEFSVAEMDGLAEAAAGLE
jgi:hypothetical protein